MMRKLPENLIKMQNQAKQETLNKVQNAIDELKDEGALITIKNLMERTELSRSTFSKAHVKDLLKENKVCKYKDRHVIAKDKSRANEILENELEQAHKKITRLSKALEKEKLRVNKLKVDYNELNENYQLLLGKWHVVFKKAKIKGINIEE